MADGAAGFRQGFSGPALLRVPLGAHSISGTRLSRSTAVLSSTVPLSSATATSRPYNPEGAVTPSVWASPRSLAATCGITVVFSSCGYLDVSVPRVRPTFVVVCLLHTGLPHSEIRGSRAICASPRLIAACHVLPRLREPRHPPYALTFISRLELSKL